MSRLTLTNAQARQLWLDQHGLAEAPVQRPDVMALISSLGFLQIDTIRNVVRAQDHILWSRAQTYREGAVWQDLANRNLYEHFTHDASLMPRDVLPLWSRRFDELGARAARGAWYQSGLAQDEIKSIRDRIEREGALSTHAFDTKVTSREMWARPPHKKALDQMWYAGDLATCHRENFVKFYDLGDRVLGDRATDLSRDEQAADLHARAMSHLGFATHGELARFWDITRPAEAKAWCERANLVHVTLNGAQGQTWQAFGTPDIEARLAALPPLTKRIRIVNPFDPAIRDRARTERLFSFTYRNEMFTPADKRQYGYYVYPLLEADRFIGRIEARADKSSGSLSIIGFWPEPGIRFGAGRRDRLEAELSRFARLGGLTGVTWTCAPPE